LFDENFPGDFYFSSKFQEIEMEFQEIFSDQNSRRLKWNSRRNPGDFQKVATLHCLFCIGFCNVDYI